MLLCSSIIFIFFFLSAPLLRFLPSFPTRRSSDLLDERHAPPVHERDQCDTVRDGIAVSLMEECEPLAVALFHEADRSEEHTSELQSPDHLVCRLLLEKKKNYPVHRPHQPSYSPPS